MHSNRPHTKAGQPDDVAAPSAAFAAPLAAFLERHDFFILTTHDPADADGLGAQMVLTCILREKGKQFRIINASPIPRHFKFMDPQGIVEQWDEERQGKLPEQSGLLLLDTADERTTGKMQDAICRAKEVFVIDHHDPKPAAAFSGIADSASASTCELTVELAKALHITLDPQTAYAAYIGIAYDTGFFAYPKTRQRTFYAVLTLLESGVKPINVYQQLHENASVESLLLQKKALSGLTLHCNNRVAVQTLRREDFIEAGALPEDTEGFVNFPLKAREIVVSLLVKEKEGKVRGALRSKGNINVAKIAQELGGGGHLNASGFKSDLDVDQTLTKALAKIAEYLDKA